MKNIFLSFFAVSLSVFSQENGIELQKKELQTIEKSKGILIWEDNFDRDDIFSTGIWAKIPRGTPDWSNTMSDDPSLFEIKEGNLILLGKNNTDNPNDPAPYITGGVFTKEKLYFHLGRIEVRCKVEAHQGAWPAIWMLPKEGAWPSGGEIDIMERLNYDDFAYQTVHSTYTQLEKENPKHYATFPINPNDYNVYAVEITPDEVCFFINDIPTFSYPRIDDNLEQFPFNRPYYLLIDMQLGGKWVGEVADLKSPIKMYIDWVRYYKR